jgi:hypothetical protein
VLAGRTVAGRPCRARAPGWRWLRRLQMVLAAGFQRRFSRPGLAGLLVEVSGLAVAASCF